LNITFIAAECAPFVKVGGLADVVGTLPPVLHRLGGHTVRVVIPHYGTIDDKKFGTAPHESFELVRNGVVTNVEVSYTTLEEVDVYFVRGWPYFSEDEDFVYHFDEGMNVGRYLFFCQAALEWIRMLAVREGWTADVFHLHDWHTGMSGYLLEQVYRDDPVLGDAATLFSIHNMMYQGWGVEWHLAQAGLPPVDSPLLSAMGKTDNSLALGIAFSTMLSTVSPTYATEITTTEGGYGLDGLLHARQAHMIGILNGIDQERWNPATSSAVAVPYTADTLPLRYENKRALQGELGLPVTPDMPLLATVTRLVEQKGIDVMIPAVRQMLLSRSAQFVVLGSGMPNYEAEMHAISADFPDQAAVRTVFNEPLSERIYAGSDLFLMPSLFEPCGIGQMIAMRYGSLPVVRRVGGLADTVDSSIGFLFGPYDAGALTATLNNALDIRSEKPDQWREMQRNAMSRDLAWTTSARRYLDLYRVCVDVHRTYA
jgi:starch synthase